MTRKLGPKSGTPVARPEPVRRVIETDDDRDDAEDSSLGGERIITRPDGHHWLSLDGRREFGPFDSFEEALADMQADVQRARLVSDPATGEDLQQIVERLFKLPPAIATKLKQVLQ